MGGFGVMSWIADENGILCMKIKNFEPFTKEGEREKKFNVLIPVYIVLLSAFRSHGKINVLSYQSGFFLYIFPYHSFC